MKIKIKNFNKGFTLLETFVALSVLIAAVLGPLSLASYSISSAGVSQNQFSAFYLAEEAMEYIKNYRDNNALQARGNWLYGLDSCISTNGCTVDTVDIPNNAVQPCSSTCPKLKYDSATNLYSYSASGNDSIFIRKVVLTAISTYEEKVSVTISWAEKFGVKSFTLEENIFNWP